MRFPPKAIVALLLAVLQFPTVADTALTVVDKISITITLSQPSDNLIIITNAGSAAIAFPTPSSNNTVIVTGSGSLLRSNIDLGNNSSNALTFLNAGAFTGTVSIAGTHNVLKMENTTNTSQSIIIDGAGNIMEFSRRSWLAAETMTFAGSELTLDGSVISSGGSLYVGSQNWQTEVTLLDHSFLGARYLYIHTNLDDTINAGINLSLSNNSTILVSEMWVGSASQSSKNNITISDSKIQALAPGKAGVIHLENADVTTILQGSIKTDRLRLAGTNLSLNIGSFSMTAFDGPSLITPTLEVLLRHPSTNALINCFSIVSLGGYLNLNIDPAHTFQRGDSLTILKSALNITGQFQNLTPGARLVFPEGSFRLNITSNTISLTEFEPTATGDPEVTFNYSPANSTLTLTFPARPGFPGIETSTDLKAWNNIPSPGIEYYDTIFFRWTTTIDAQDPQRYFRVTLTE